MNDLTRTDDRVFALILNFNGLADTRRAIGSLARLGDLIERTLVLDNGSDMDESIVLRKEFPSVEIERVERNLGFSRGVNHIARRALRAGARYLLLMNSDAEFFDYGESLRELLQTLSADPSLVAAGPVILNEDGTVQSAGYRYSLWFPLPRAIRRIPGGPVNIDGFLSGSCVLLDARKFAELGGLDPDYFLYGEDLDFAFRAVAAGMRMTCVPRARVFHRRAASSNLYSNRYVYTALRGNLVLESKHAAWYQWPTAMLMFLAISIALVAMGTTRGHCGTLLAIAKAWIDFIDKRWGGLTGEKLTPCERPSTDDVPAVADEASARVRAKLRSS